MPRTTVQAVEDIIEVDELITNIDPFIEAANALVTEICEPQGYDDVRLELIERWLAAHFYAIRDPRITDEKASSVSVKYESKVDLYFTITRYGQQALILDTKGGLAALQEQTKQGGKRVLKMGWLGTDPQCRSS